MLNANIFEDGVMEEDSDVADYVRTVGDVASGEGMVITVRKTIAGIYVTLRNICALIMLAGLIFTGIRILVTANIPTKRTQYLMLLQDWLMGMILLVFSHIIMIGIFYISDTLVNAVALSTSGFGGLNANLIVQCLLSFDSAEQIICLIMLGYMIYLTVIFAIAYFKRFLWICVLTVFAPIVSVMYAFGQQTKPIYSKWLREYMMTVFVQPFHIIVYWVLVSIPLDMVNSTVAYSLTNMFELIYALVAISFIRPAEKYIRDLFGMGQGIAGVASFDSGKQTFDAAKRMITDTVKKVGLAVATVATGGAAGAAGATAKAAGGTAAKVAAKEGGKKLLGEAAGKGAETVGSKLLGNDAGINEALPKDSVLEKYKNDGYGQNAFGEYFNPNTDDWDNNYDPHKDSLYNPEYDENEQGFLSNNDNEDAADKLNEAAERLIEAANSLENGASGGLSENDVEITNGSGGTPVKEKKSKNPIKRYLGFVAKGSQRIIDANDMLNGDESIIDTAQGAFGNAYRWVGKTKTGQKLKDTKLYQKAKEKASQGLEVGKAFENMGGFKDLYKGLNELRDTFFVTPPPQDWKTRYEDMDASKKKKDEQTEYNIVHNEGNKQFIIKADKLMEKYRAQYPNKSEAYIESLAEAEAEKRLASIAKSYVPFGITKVETMHALKQDQKRYGYSPEEALTQAAGFNKFNTSSGNISDLNATYQISVNSVTEAMPYAKDYYNSGYTNIQNMRDVQFIQEKLKTSSTMAMNIEKALRTNGTVNYKGNDPEIKKVFDDINSYYAQRNKK